MILIKQILCNFFHIHLKGISGQSCLHNITVCDYCNKDVLFVLKDRYDSHN